MIWLAQENIILLALCAIAGFLVTWLLMIRTVKVQRIESATVAARPSTPTSASATSVAKTGVATSTGVAASHARPAAVTTRPDIDVVAGSGVAHTPVADRPQPRLAQAEQSLEKPTRKVVMPSDPAQSANSTQSASTTQAATAAESTCPVQAATAVQPVTKGTLPNLPPRSPQPSPVTDLRPFDDQPHENGGAPEQVDLSQGSTETRRQEH